MTSPVRGRGQYSRTSGIVITGQKRHTTEFSLMLPWLFHAWMHPKERLFHTGLYSVYFDRYFSHSLAALLRLLELISNLRVAHKEERPYTTTGALVGKHLGRNGSFAVSRCVWFVSYISGTCTCTYNYLVTVAP